MFYQDIDWSLAASLCLRFFSWVTTSWPIWQRACWGVWVECSASSCNITSLRSLLPMPSGRAQTSAAWTCLQINWLVSTLPRSLFSTGWWCVNWQETLSTAAVSSTAFSPGWKHLTMSPTPTIASNVKPLLNWMGTHSWVQSLDMEKLFASIFYPCVMMVW